ncbi:hypothetical protein BKI52_15875 [marine bacterium AO1-C]|nr:hypothetical protein BKI52_15875 [marine bacterium AO1-C]
MANPEQIRNLRLQNAYKEMVNLQAQGNIISWRILQGRVPLVEVYELTVRVRSIISTAPRYRDQHVIKITMPGDYPTSPPIVQMISSPQPFHPNWYENGTWCFGRWDMAESLGSYVCRMIQTLQFDEDITNADDPANREAGAWYKRYENSGLFPCDHQTLPDPTKEKKKKFDIRR